MFNLQCKKYIVQFTLLSDQYLQNVFKFVTKLFRMKMEGKEYLDFCYLS